MDLSLMILVLVRAFWHPKNKTWNFLQILLERNDHQHWCLSMFSKVNAEERWGKEKDSNNLIQNP